MIVLTAFAAYHNSFSGPFVFDDPGSVTDNPTVRHFGSALFPPTASTMSGRPFPNLTLALNFALNGTDPRGYHVLNLLIHTLAGLTLFGVLHRTLLQPALRARFGIHAAPLALAAAAIWTLHPLQTEAVTYISQRAESLMGLCYLFTLYAFIRSAESPTPWRWQIVSVVSCLLGMASKEVMISAPLLVLLYDRTFITGTFKHALKKSRWLYTGLAGTWLLLAALILNTGDRNGTAGFNSIITPWTYLLTQCQAISHYLRLAFWPYPLVFDYGSDVVQSANTVLLPASLLLALAAGTVVALRRWPMTGFFGVWFFAILAPSSSFVPVVTQTMAEHRMYLPLAAIICPAVIGLYAWLGRRSLLVWPFLAIGLGFITFQRNRDYQSNLALWTDTVAKCPTNPRAHNNLGLILADLPGKAPEAIAHYEAALRLQPDYPSAHNNLGVVLTKLPGRSAEAIKHYEAALRSKPAYAEAHNNLGLELAENPERLVDAIAHFEAALRCNPDYEEAHNNLGVTLARIPGRERDAIGHYEAALKIKPTDAEAHNNLGLVLANNPGRINDAVGHYETAIQIKPDYAEAHNNLGAVLAHIPGRTSEVINHYEAALRIRPAYSRAHNNLGLVLADISGRENEATSHYEAALRDTPHYAEAHNNLGVVLARDPNRLQEAIAHLEAALVIKPSYALAHNNLGMILGNIPGRLPDAIAHFQAAVLIDPDFALAQKNLALAKQYQAQISP